MEHRKPPRVVTAEEPESDLGNENETVRRRRFARFVTPPNERRLSRVRIVLALGLAAGLIYLLALVGSYGVRSLRTFVHGQAEYQLQFTDIELNPPPPAWYRGGARRFLQQIREQSGEPERFSVLDLELPKLRLAFKRYAWVRNATVSKVNPNRVIVELEYREPVAKVDVNGVPEACLIDRDGVVLNPDDVATEALTTLRLTRTGGNPPPYDVRFGETWKSASGPNRLPKVDDRILAGARLADALQKELARDREQKRPRFTPFVMVQTPQRVWVQFGDREKSVLIEWGVPPTGEEPPAESVSAKWKVVRDWVEHDQLTSKGPRHLKLANGELVPHPGGH